MKTLALNVALREEKGEEPRQRDFNSTSRNEIMALIGVLFLLAIKKRSLRLDDVTDRKDREKIVRIPIVSESLSR
ncbi:unnamed protein product [Macrosiphum euphorbiae]|uniref:Uncharacterized protein n=1 Tax=Macrosiphum euphorbiae TaxID=13131 RepID=A0AAV0Y8I7_9HEMI|nr:unnamed protein product [Macrosiphum euphorbiae]